MAKGLGRNVTRTQCWGEHRSGRDRGRVVVPREHGRALGGHLAPVGLAAEPGPTHAHLAPSGVRAAVPAAVGLAPGRGVLRGPVAARFAAPQPTAVLFTEP